MNRGERFNASSIPLWAALVLLAGCTQNDAEGVSPTGITKFKTSVSFTTPSREECIEQTEDSKCTLAKVSSSNVGLQRGDTLCDIHLFNRKGEEMYVINMLIASDIDPGSSKEWSVHIPVGLPDSHRANCPAYDPGALKDIG